MIETTVSDDIKLLDGDGRGRAFEEVPENVKRIISAIIKVSVDGLEHRPYFHRGRPHRARTVSR